jgi:methylmalonyl-CoA/ethylmalonyl-CoA epimerase
VATHSETNDEQGVREAMLSAPGDGGAAVQLLAPLRPDSPIGKFLDRNGPGLQQVAYRVADIDAACAALRERGVRLLYDAPRRGTANSRINFLHPRDAGGVLVELVQPAAGTAH